MPIIQIKHTITRFPDGSTVQGGWEYRMVSWRQYIAFHLRRLFCARRQAEEVGG